MHRINSKKEEKRGKKGFLTDKSRNSISFICQLTSFKEYLHVKFLRQVININNCQPPIGFKWPFQTTCQLSPFWGHTVEHCIKPELSWMIHSSGNTGFSNATCYSSLCWKLADILIDKFNYAYIKRRDVLSQYLVWSSWDTQGWILVTTSCLCIQERGKDISKRQFRFNVLSDSLGVVAGLVCT